MSRLLKYSFIKPFFKKGGRSPMSNYRLIRFSNIFEVLVFWRIKQHHNILVPKQQCFSPTMVRHWDLGLNPTVGHGCLSVVRVVCCQVEVSAMSWSLVQRSPADRGASLCDVYKSHEWGGRCPPGGCHVKNKQTENYYEFLRLLITLWYCIQLWVARWHSG